MENYENNTASIKGISKRKLDGSALRAKILQL